MQLLRISTQADNGKPHMATEAHDTLWNAYLSAYGRVTDDERKHLLIRSVTDDVVFTNPNGTGCTRAGLIAHIENFQMHMPGAYFRTEKIFDRNDELLAIWTLHDSNDTKVSTGYNFIQFDDDGRFRYMAGFF